jgi:hypothetical protein
MVSNLRMNVSRDMFTRNVALTGNEAAGFKEIDPESSSSGSEYKDKDNGDKSKSDRDSELDVGPASSDHEEPELENEEPDTRIKLKAGKKQKKGLVARDQISVVAAAIYNEASPRLGSDSDYSGLSGKRVAGIAAGSKT